MEMNLGQVRLGTDFFQALQGLPKAEAAPLPGTGAAGKAAQAVSQPLSEQGLEAARAAFEAGEAKPRGSYLNISA
jgi:hypothetical protein